MKGKILFDAIICKPRLANQETGDVEYWLDVADYDVEAVLKHLKKYSIRKKVHTEDISHVIKSFSV